MSLKCFNDIIGLFGNIIAIGTFISACLGVFRRKPVNKNDYEKNNSDENSKIDRVPSLIKDKKNSSSKINSLSDSSANNDTNLQRNESPKIYRYEEYNSRRGIKKRFYNSSSSDFESPESIAFFSIIMIASFVLYSWTYNLIPAICGIFLVVIILDASKKPFVSYKTKITYISELCCYLFMLLSLVNIPEQSKKIFYEISTIDFSSSSGVWLNKIFKVFHTNLVDKNLIQPISFISVSLRVFFSYLFIFILIKKILRIVNISEINSNYTQPISNSIMLLMMFLIGLNITKISELIIPIFNFLL